MTVSGIFAVPFAPNTHTTNCAWFSLKDRAVEVISRAFCALRATLESPELTVWEKAFQCRQFAVYTAHLGMTKQQLKQITRSVLSRERAPSDFQTTLTESGNRLFRNGSSAWDLHQLWTRVEEKLQGRAPPFFIEVCQEARARLQEHLRQNRQEAISCFYRGLTYWIIEVSYNHSLELSLLEYFREIVPTELYLEASTVLKGLAELLQTKATTLTPNERQQACKQACRDLDQIFFPVRSKAADEAIPQGARCIKSEPLLQLISRVALSYLILQNRSHSTAPSIVGNLLGGAAMGLISVPVVSAASTAQGLEFRVNDFTSGEQSHSAVASLINGDIIIVWTSAEQDGSGRGVYGKRYAKDGTEIPPPVLKSGAALGNEFQINTYTLSDQQEPAISMLGKGGFIVAWTSDGQDRDGSGVFMKRYSSNATEMKQPTSGINGALGNEFLVNSYVTGDQRAPAIAAMKDNGFIVVWQSNKQDGDLWGVYAKRYSHTGEEMNPLNPGLRGAIGTEFSANSYTLNEQRNPKVGVSPNGDFFISWVSTMQDKTPLSIYGKLFKYSGSEVAIPNTGDGAKGDELRVNTYSDGAQGFSSIAFLRDETFVVVWQSDNQDGDLLGCFGKQFFADGTEKVFPTSGTSGALGKEFPVNVYTFSDQEGPVIASLPKGGIIVIWTSYGQGITTSSLFGRKYGAKGDAWSLSKSGTMGAVSSEFPINPNPAGYYLWPTLTAQQNSQFIVSWTGGLEEPAADSDIFMIRYDENGMEVTPSPTPTGTKASDTTAKTALEIGVAAFGGVALMSCCIGGIGCLIRQKKRTQENSSQIDQVGLTPRFDAISRVSTDFLDDAATTAARSESTDGNLNFDNSQR